MPPPPEPTTLIEVLEQRARERPEALAFTFEEQAHTYGGLWAAIEHRAAVLGERGVGPGDRVVLVLPNGPEFFAAFYGTQRAGAIPVPIFPGSGAGRILDLAAACGASLVVLDPAVGEQTAAPLRAAAGEGGPTLLRTSGEPAHGAPEVVEDRPGTVPGAGWPKIRPEDPGLIQYTSGSTGNPKGVVLSHANLLTNVRQMIAGMEITAGEVFVSWLPVHHDMGLVLMTMVPFYLGARLVLLPSSLTHVGRWLEAVTVHCGTFTAAPDFAYRLCLSSIRDPRRYDLRSLRVALDAAEPVRAETIRRFEEVFGLDRVMVPGYGLAEATVGVSMQPPGTCPKVSDRGLVAIGRPFPDIRIHILAGGRPAGPGEIGELVIESPANTTGYFRNPEATARLLWGPGCVRTGDLGYRDEEGDVFLVGRIKSIILQAGRNLAPQEIEETVEALPFVRRAAAVGIDRGRIEGEQAYVFAELRRALAPPEETLHEMAVEVVARIHQRLGLRPGRVLFLKPRSIPLTANGKIRYQALRESYLDGRLRAGGGVLFPPW